MRLCLFLTSFGALAALALACTAEAQTGRAPSPGRYEPGASLGASPSSPPPLTAPLNTARPVPNPAAPATPRSYQRDYPRESTPLNPPSYRKHDLPGEWRD
jgi:hypothetical protein